MRPDSPFIVRMWGERREMLIWTLTYVEVHLANWFFEGARADVAKVVSANPAFQLTHSFQLNAQGGKYNFGAIFANASVGLLDRRSGRSLTNRHSYRVVWTGVEP